MGAHRFRGPSDLHLHSAQSDGTQSPADVMRAAHDHGVRTAALTDHDTTAGWVDAAAAAVSLQMTLLPGMEMSTRHRGRSVHLLAYLFDPDDAALRAEIEHIRSSRRDRARTMTERIGRDYSLTWADVLAQTGDETTIGRPHIADALIAKEHVRDRTEAFAGILDPRGDYYVALYSPDPVTAVRLVVAAGGVPIIAHPASRGGVPTDDVLLAMLDAGLAGFELDHRENRAEGVRRLARLVVEHDLIVTGSSDYHGSGKPNLPGEHTTSDEMVQRIIDAARGTEPVYG
ncbi:PHP domain-containing protein [Microbacterium sp. KR10-403]|uniref:PHP domain-containing protein n=1 Tax=Microbacterium sp. KR10-403 TaxID=3158581 RepID=UPI0032E3B04D